ncbi:precorrin-6A synthase (deacetylating) [Pseudogemmobacter faecipullorum]|uniref:Precorrin-6A synthase [deacetylating] n=1 Tax=Pseudogemmobacter faecipullorum TaxID=2755041 RepID=A0ABS8CMR4_9RHOB|nr:precorrin-6A synthase (deacetylating) [Pseudogemmobacter faecipullorum]MCB5410664.1 precorrin-6A synthase (deacetylating) [Pseudogemmobacter faecipullorum]
MQISLIGIGSGDPQQLTGEAVAALSAADYILMPVKSGERRELSHLREIICARFAPGARILAFDMPERDPLIADYRARVEAWHDEINRRWLAALDQVPEGAGVACLVWGDPALYDSTLRIAGRARQSRAFSLRVLPGIMSLQSLTAAHRITLNELTEPFLVTTGRHLREQGWPAGISTLVVMLDGENSFMSLPAEGVTIWWGAYLGMEGELLDHGALALAGPRILQSRAQARAARGWIMDIYILRR